MSTDANPNSAPVTDTSLTRITDTKKIGDPEVTDTKKIQDTILEDTPRRGKVCSPSPNQGAITSIHTKTHDLTSTTDVTKSPMSQDIRSTYVFRS